MKRFLVIGLGRFGNSLAKTLSSIGEEVIAVDASMARVEEVKERVPHAVQLDSTDPDALKSIGCDRVDVAIIAIGENLEASVVTTVILKEMGIKEIIVRAYSDREKKILELIGATRVIFVEDEMGRRLAKAISGEGIRDYIELSPNYSIVHWDAPEALVGTSLADLKLTEEWRLILLAVKKKEESLSQKFGFKKEPERLELYPTPEYRLEQGEVLILVGKHRDLMRFTTDQKHSS
ncbi:MAG: TrkA family potassium uptake protein [Candidatus Manganitrophus sp.]|nr:TrkA family potassium uptake protein [Candidatus Manganitrophus sp.]MDC4227177.1 TrkA family potassium uptake protein [Candidatus Manganitrophus sp.]WDT71427.1 MAG: TrkA family potassium uptake protein [Candidatus Manganitrophus sp.]WDT76320.1 MAG: TrkA family potassium uptake protein [Candidatus Manganitrophus sp.]WDT81243.1 MAG: TrkA family potassium uptake protein [Candidatus Manganitrophus sp.]